MSPGVVSGTDGNRLSMQGGLMMVSHVMRNRVRSGDKERLCAELRADRGALEQGIEQAEESARAAGLSAEAWAQTVVEVEKKLEEDETLTHAFEREFENLTDQLRRGDFNLRARADSLKQSLEKAKRAYDVDHEAWQQAVRGRDEASSTQEMWLAVAKDLRRVLRDLDNESAAQGCSTVASSARARPPSLIAGPLFQALVTAARVTAERAQRFVLAFQQHRAPVTSPGQTKSPTDPLRLSVCRAERRSNDLLRAFQSWRTRR
jgi:hypothetical protein